MKTEKWALLVIQLEFSRRKRSQGTASALLPGI
jgi:hypothetical protein